MDHWGDPWADDDADVAPPKQEEVATSNKPAFSAAPVLLNSFLDDPQWGINDDEGFGGWETSIGDTDLVHPTPPDARVPDPSPTLSATKLPDATALHEEEEKRSFEVEDDGWGSLAQSEESLKEVDNVVSETSDSATTIRPDDGRPRASTDVSDVPQLDDELSTRTSTTPSDISHTEAPPVESPRTSIEDERTTGTALEVSASIHEEEAKTEDVIESPAPQVEPVEDQEPEEDMFGDFEEETQEESEFEDEEKELALDILLPPERDPVIVKLETEPAAERKFKTMEESAPKDSPATAPTSVLSWELDRPIIDQLFRPPKPSKEPFEGADELISMTSTRKAWYRLTRKSTMREYNTGIDDENYVRVTWANSHIKEEAKKIVHRWTTEDRNSRRGHSANASFYWDHSPSNAPTTRLRKKSIIAESSTLQPAKQNAPPLSTNVPAAFSWSSSPLAVHDPWRQDSLNLESTSSPIIAKSDALTEVPAPNSGAVFVDLTPRTPDQPMHPRTPILENPASLPPAASSFEPSKESDPWANLSSLDTSSSTKVTDTTNDDDDEWGEMVESPAVSTTTPMADLSQISSHNTTLPTPSSTPKSVKCSPLQPQVSRHASPIVRLKGAVSPTSSAFRFNNFGPVIPASANVEPIGPNLLKRATTNLTPVKTVTETEPAAQPQQKIEVQYRRSVFEREESDDLPVFESSTSQPPPSEIAEFAAFEPSTARPEFSTSDSFTAFESSILAPAPASTLTTALDPVQPTNLPSSPSIISLNMPSSTTPAQTTTDSRFFATSKNTPSASNPQTPIDPWFDTSSSIPTAPAPAPVEDSWSNADFSFFESAAPAPLSQAENPPSPSDPWSVFSTPVPVAALPQIEARVPIPSPKMSIPGGTVSNSEQKRKAEEEKVVREILEGLPDLRYMLR